MSTAPVETTYYPALPVKDLQTSDFPTILDDPNNTGISHHATRPWGGGLFCIADIGLWMSKQSVDFQAGITNILRIKGIDTRQDMIFQFNVFGNAILVSDHPDQDTIESILNGDDELRHSFMAIASTARFLDAISARPDFEERYQTNPEDAMLEYISIAASLTRPTFNLQVSRAGVTTYFTPLR